MSPLSFNPDPDYPPPGIALAFDGVRFEELPGLTAELLDQLIDEQDLAERRRAPMPTLKGWLVQRRAPRAIVCGRGGPLSAHDAELIQAFAHQLEGREAFRCTPDADVSIDLWPVAS